MLTGEREREKQEREREREKERKEEKKKERRREREKQVVTRVLGSFQSPHLILCLAAIFASSLFFHIFLLQNETKINRQLMH